MQPVIEILQSVGVLFAGLLARFGLFLAMLAMLVLPALSPAALRHCVRSCPESCGK